MPSFSHTALGTKLIIHIYDDSVDTQSIDAIFSEIDIFEKKYSRFIAGNLLHRLNTEKCLHMPDEFISILKVWNTLSHLSDGYFDMTVLPFLENIDYGIASEKQKEVYGYTRIEIWADNYVTLHDDIQVEIGSIGKGYALDLAYNTLDKRYSEFTLNFWGDIRIKWEKKIYLEDPLDDTKILWEIHLKNQALACSNPEKRKTKKWSHLIQHKEKIDTKKTVFTIHPQWIFADWFATTLFVSPLEKSIKILENTKNLEALIISEEGEIYKSKWFKVKLYI